MGQGGGGTMPDNQGKQGGRGGTMPDNQGKQWGRGGQCQTTKVNSGVGGGGTNSAGGTE